VNPPCPECAAIVPSTPGYADWCDACGWNLEPSAAAQVAEGRFGRLAERLGRRSGDRMARRLLAEPRLAPRLTPQRIAAYAVALAVHAFTLALLCAGVAMIVVDFPNALGLLIGLALAGVALVIRPRLDRLEPGDGHRLDPAVAPALHELAAAVAHALDRPPPDLILVDHQWNASWRRVGIRRRGVLTLGLPLLVALDPAGRVAVIGHELAHDRNGDATRSLSIGSAVSGLDRLSDVLRPEPGSEGFIAEIAMLEWLTSWLLWLVSRPVDAVLWLEARLLMHDRQRAEYLADALAAQVAGTAAVVEVHERLLLGSTVSLAIQQAATADATDVLDRVRAAVVAVPERERERRRRVARLEHARLDYTHPPTGMRIAFLEGRPAEAPTVRLDGAVSARIDAELEPLARTVDRELLDLYRGSLYYG
jgi:Zn-dependent protease with chaperone function